MASTQTAAAPLNLLGITRRFTKPGVHPYDEITWERRHVQLKRPDGSIKFEQKGVEVPSFWSITATNIVADKYFAYGIDDPRRENSARQLVDRVVHRLGEQGAVHGYFNDADGNLDPELKEIFEHELTYILIHQMAAFNSPVWFNVGKKNSDGSYIDEQCSACFLLSVDDDLDDIAEWMAEEGRIFKRGSGAGVNVSRLRGSMEKLSLGGHATGPVTFMRAADAFAGTIQSGGTTRRAAKMVICDIDHPDVQDFIWCKVREEERVAILKAAGVEIGLGSEEGERNLAEATAYQNANNSVRLSDAFMNAVENDEEWNLIARTTGETTRTVRARDLMREISDAAWRCADPGVQYDTTINKMHTTPVQGRISTSNPCSEYMSNDDTACNLSSLNLLKFLRSTDNTIDVEAYRHVARIMFTAQDITICFSHFPTERIKENTPRFRQIGAGFANLGALLMAMGLPYDSDEGRAVAGAMTSLLTAECYLQSTHLAEMIAPFEHYRTTGIDEDTGREVDNVSAMRRVISTHRASARTLSGVEQKDLLKAAKGVWNEVLKRGDEHGYRNSQATVLAPTGTISFLMDCDTTGVEPDFSLVKYKVMAGGAAMSYANKTIDHALERLGYDVEQRSDIVEHIEAHGNVVGAPHLSEDHYSVFDVAVGPRAISWQGHVGMMAACQPFLSGAISKTVNLPDTATIEDIQDVYVQGWKLGLKAIAVYRDGSKNAQPLNDAHAASKSGTGDVSETQMAEIAQQVREQVLGELRSAGELKGARRKMPDDLPNAVQHKFKIGMMSGWITVGLFEDGTPGQVMISTSQAGSALRAMYDSWARLFSYCLQFGMPLDFLVSKLAFTSFEPQGFVSRNAPFATATSIIDYVVRWLASEYLPESTHEQLAITRKRDTGAPVAVAAPVSSTPDPAQEVSQRVEVHGATVARVEAPAPAISEVVAAQPKFKLTGNGAGNCNKCGGILQRTGTCTTCTQCGDNTGCG